MLYCKTWLQHPQVHSSHSAIGVELCERDFTHTQKEPLVQEGATMMRYVNNLSQAYYRNKFCVTNEPQDLIFLTAVVWIISMFAGGTTTRGILRGMGRSSCYRLLQRCEHNMGRYVL